MNPQFEKYADWNPVAGTLVFRNNRLYLNLVVEKEFSLLRLNPSSPSDFLGIDRGINNISTCSNNQFFNSTHLRKVKGNTNIREWYCRAKALLQQEEN